MAMSQHRVKCPGANGFHEMAYVEWGDPSNPRILLCVHGLTRNGRDFDVLAAALQEDYRVVCPDVVGRGKSDWLTDSAQYQPLQYAADMMALIAQLGADQVDWLGTSMGGIIGMVMASAPRALSAPSAPSAPSAQAGSGGPIRRMVLNDVGPFIAKTALDRIGAYVGNPPTFDDVAGVETYLRQVHAPFGDLTDAQWAYMAAHGARQVEDGWTLGYDPRIADAFAGIVENADMWGVWDAISCPTLVLRGEASDLLSPETATEMTERGPKADLAVIPGCGHAPALMDEDQIAIVRNWLATEAH